MQQQRNILTIATGKKLYADMAANLVRSFILWNKDNEINFFLATDIPQHLPDDVKGYITIIKLNHNELGKGFSPKLHLDKLAPEGQTLFIDSDCLVYDDIRLVFDKFRGHNVSVVGSYIAEGEWFGDVSMICKKFGIKHIPKFNGGIYYLEQGPKASQIYETARGLETQYDEIGFVRLRGCPNDEVLMALSMQLHDQKPIVDDGTIMSDPLCCQAPYKANVITGKTCLINPPAPHPLHQNWYPFNEVSPLIIHFLGHHNADYQYQKDVYRLKKKGENKLNMLTECNALVSIEFKKRLELFLKNKFRKVYHLIFGVRRIKRSERI